jgi:ABC-type branched-subunit amino acid transport system permease subunit
MPLRTKIAFAVAIVVLAAAIVVPIAVDDPYIQRVMAIAALESLLAVSLNLVLGYGGLISLAQVAFYGVGAYTAALLALRLHLPFLLNLPASIVLCGAVAWMFARPLLRLRGHYFAIATFVFALLAQAIENNWESVTRGTNGLPGIPTPSLVVWTAETNLDDYFLALGLLVACLLVVARVVHSPFGRSLAAVRDDDRAAASVGIEVGRVRTIAFVLAAAIAGAGGALYAQYTTFVSAQPFGTDHMITILAAAAIGGLGTLAGPVAGATLLTMLPEVLRGISNWRMVVFGALVIVVVLVRPDGLAGLARAAWAAVVRTRRSGLDR